MVSPDRLTFRVNGIEDLLALIPHMLGFEPEASLVLIAMGPRGGILTARLDLPAPGEAAAASQSSLDLLIAKLQHRDSVSVTLVGYGPADLVQTTVDTATDALRHAGIPVSDALRVADGRFWRLPSTEPDDGIPFEPATSPAATAATAAGLVALPDRAALAATLAPVTGPARNRMIAATATAAAHLVELMRAALTDTPGSGESGEDPGTALRTPLGLAMRTAARAYLIEAHDSYRSGQPIGDDDAAALTVLLELPWLRDFAARRTSREAWQIQMWTDLVRRAESPFTAGPATMLALSALHAGDGTLANIAIERALNAAPDNQFAKLLARVIATGVDPDTIAALLAD